MFEDLSCMATYTVITENDESAWEDVTGIQYHFPNRYLKWLKPGTIVLYYKGRLKNKKYKLLRLADEPHYFGTGIIKEIREDGDSKNSFAVIDEFNLFTKAVPFKIKSLTIEDIPSSRATNYWRDGVRPITKEIFDKVISLADGQITTAIFHDQAEDSFESVALEGGKKKIYTTVYERNKAIRDTAIKIHGYSCMACGFNFKETYGEWGEGYIHVHHLNPVSTKKEKSEVNPKTDLVVVCANCHSMIHRRKDKVLTLDELKALL